MPTLSEITPLVLTFNEAPNIARTLGRLAWAARVVVVDSFSTDETLAICATFPNVHIVQRTFDSFSGQLNFGMTRVETPWVLTLDADYVLSESLVEELSALGGELVDGYAVRFTYCVAGRPLRGTVYPPRVVLFRRDRAHHRQDGHAQRLEIVGTTRMLRGCVLHDDRKPLDRWFADQLRYSTEEADHLAAMPPEALSRLDRVRLRTPLTLLLVPAYALIYQGGLFDGWPGWLYAMQRALAETLLAIRLVDRRLRQAAPAGVPGRAGSIRE